MNHPNDRDERIREIFSAAREADRASAPEFQEIVDRERTDGRSGATRRGFRLASAFALAASLAVIALASVWLSGPARQGAPVQVAEHRPRATPASPPPAPAVLPAEDPAVEPPPPVVEPDVASKPAAAAADATHVALQPPAPPPPPLEVLAAETSIEEIQERKRRVRTPVANQIIGAEQARRLRALGYEGDVESTPVPSKSEPVARISDELIADPIASARARRDALTMAPGVQDADGNGLSNVHSSRSRDFGALVGGVSNVDPLTGQSMSRINTNSIEEMEVITAAAGVELGRAQGGFAAVVGADDAEQWQSGAGVEPDLQRDRSDFNTEDYDRIVENEFLAVTENPLSTFSIDVDSASYANVRRFLNLGQRPPPDAVRIEELINYFRYDYPEPTDGAPFAVHTEVAGCPWNDEHRLVRIGLKGREITRGETAGSNLVFLIDVSGSMSPRMKLPLLKQALSLLVEQLDGRDQVAIVVYAGASGLVLPSTPGNRKQAILAALQRLASGGSTNGGAGLKLAYRIARENFIPGGVNRVILATDGDFNIGVTTRTKLLSLIEKDARNGVFLTVLGFGMGNYQDGMLEMLTGRGNGNYAYIDSNAEARKVLVEQMSGTLIAIAKDVKIQIEFNPAEVGRYRLIGYENRVMPKEHFNDDRQDAGEIGAGHTVTALYEIVPAGRWEAAPAVDPLKYQTTTEPTEAAGSGELLTVKLRYKEPDEDTSSLITRSVPADERSLEVASDDFKFATAVAEFGLLMRESAYKADASFEQVAHLALQGRGADENGYRAEFLDLVERARRVVVADPAAESEDSGP
jgi:Ca-activated chloride channel family protein